MIYTAVNDFYLSQSELNASASRADGVSAPLEAQLRRYGCDAIAEAVVLLHLPQSVACTAQVLLHRFYCKRSLTRFDIKITAMASAWLAAKLEEVIEIDSFQPLRLRDIIMVFYRVFRRKDNKYVDFIYPGTSRYDVIKTEVVRTERHMLRAFGFIVNVEHPHRFVLTFGQLLGLERDVLQVGWTLANDTLRSTTLCVRYRAEIVACGILYVAAKRSSTPMPEHPPWWRVFIGGSGSEEVLAAVVREIIEVEKLPRAEYVVLVKDYTSRGVGVPGAASPPPPFAPAPVPMPAQTTTIVKPQEPVKEKDAGDEEKNDSRDHGSTKSMNRDEEYGRSRSSRRAYEDVDDGRRRRRRSRYSRSRSRSRSRDRGRGRYSRSPSRDRRRERDREPRSYR